jgi:hypothetical protein
MDRFIGTIRTESTNIIAQVQEMDIRQARTIHTALSFFARDLQEAAQFFISYYLHLFKLHLTPDDFFVYKEGASQ